jgi:indole-3-glycerol phosphate synthase
LIDLVQEGTPLVSESGVKTRQDVLRLAGAGVSAVLVGETLMRARDMAAKIRELFCPDAV